MTSETPWYTDGLRFECSQCGDCCTGAPGFVWVSQAEIDAIAEEVGMASEQFEDTYVRKIGARRSLREFPNGDCVFFDTENKGCQVYGARPIQCRTWPFWDSNLKSEKSWKETCEECPGSGAGKVYSLEEIEGQRKQMRI
ncbi:MAG: YkgJ family cysteine cluster protein [Pirellulales bacterium]|nr:YkgJ family cysteine cluster protein [Pirellulales bacterium]